jgi:hypothetical protein
MVNQLTMDLLCNPKGFAMKCGHAMALRQYLQQADDKKKIILQQRDAVGTGGSETTKSSKGAYSLCNPLASHVASATSLGLALHASGYQGRVVIRYLQLEHMLAV